MVKEGKKSKKIYIKYVLKIIVLILTIVASFFGGEQAGERIAINRIQISQGDDQMTQNNNQNLNISIDGNQVEITPEQYMDLKNENETLKQEKEALVAENEDLKNNSQISEDSDKSKPLVPKTTESNEKENIVWLDSLSYVDKEENSTLSNFVSCQGSKPTDNGYYEHAMKMSLVTQQEEQISKSKVGDPAVYKISYALDKQYNSFFSEIYSENLDQNRSITIRAYGDGELLWNRDIGPETYGILMDFGVNGYDVLTIEINGLVTPNIVWTATSKIVFDKVRLELA